MIKCSIALLIILFVFSFTPAQAQEEHEAKNVFFFSPTGIIAGKFCKLSVRYQHTLKGSVAMGTDVKYYFSEFPGYQVKPFVKAFLGKSREDGFYFDFAASVGANRGHEHFSKVGYGMYGFGLGFGFQKNSTSTSRLCTDAGIGFRLARSGADKYEQELFGKEFDFYLLGPGAFIDGFLGIGWRF